MEEIIEKIRILSKLYSFFDDRKDAGANKERL